MVKALIGILVAAALAAGLWFTMKETPAADTSQASAPAAAPVDTASRGTLASLFGMSGSYVCTVTSDATSGFSHGTVRVKDGNVRGEFVTTSDGGEMTATMIKTGDAVYTWSSAMPMGVKAAATSIDAPDGTTPASDTQMFDTGASVEYDCEPTTLDDALFIPPQDIEFMDMTKGMPTMPDVSKMMR